MVEQPNCILLFDHSFGPHAKLLRQLQNRRYNKDVKPMPALPADRLIIGVGRKPLCDAEFPLNAPLGGFVFYMREATINEVRQGGPPWKYYSAKLVEKTIADPLAIFKGLKRCGLEDGFCYTAKPSRIETDGSGIIDVPPEQIFLVFSDASRIVFDWEFRVGAPGKVGYPSNSTLDFEECIWTRQ